MKHEVDKKWRFTGSDDKTNPTALIHSKMFVRMLALSVTKLPLNMTSNSLFPTSGPLTGRAISSTHVAYSACAAGFANSLNRQSQAGNGGGLFPAIALHCQGVYLPLLASQTTLKIYNAITLLTHL